MRLIDADKFKEYILGGLAGALPKFKSEGSANFASEITKSFLEDIDAQPTVLTDRWVPVTEALPVVETEVLILTRNKTVTTGMYEDGTVLETDSSWYWEDGGEYSEEDECDIIPNGWWEYKHYNGDGCLNNVIDDEVIAWMPLPYIGDVMRTILEEEQKCEAKMAEDI